MLFEGSTAHSPKTIGLYKISLDGKGLALIREFPKMYMGELSRDEKQYVFIPEDSKENILYVLDLSSGKIRQVAKTRKWLEFPFWSPDNLWVGAKLVTNYPGEAEFAVWNLTTGERRPIPLNFGYDFQWWTPQTETPPDCEKIVQEMLGPGEKLEALPVNSTSQK